MIFYLKETPESLLNKINSRPDGIPPSQVSLDWECENGHSVIKSFSEIGRKGCAQFYQEGQAITYQEAQKAASVKGYTLAMRPAQFNKALEDAFKNGIKPSQAKLKWSCGMHTWWSTYDQMKRITHSCPTCGGSYYETQTRKLFKQTFGVEFLTQLVKQIFTKLGVDSSIVNNIHGRLEYDGYAEIIVAGRRVRIAFEYNGDQHYQFPNGIHRTYKEWIESIERDERKVELSQGAGIILITIPYHSFQNKNARSYIKSFIISQFEQQFRTLYNIPSFNFDKSAVSQQGTTLLNFLGKKP